jgi:hypothetical protein
VNASTAVRGADSPRRSLIERNERVLHLNPAEVLIGVQVLGQEDLTVGCSDGFDDERIPEREV